MKKSVITIGAVAIISATTLISCFSNDKKVEEAKHNVVVAKQELNQAIKDSIQDFKNQSEQKIVDYEKQIEDLKAYIDQQDKKDKSIYEKEIAILEKKNKEMKDKLINFKDESQEKWLVFQKEFNTDMDELGTAFKNFVKKDN